jgi:hypothetical protein
MQLPIIERSMGIRSEERLCEEVNLSFGHHQLRRLSLAEECCIIGSFQRNVMVTSTKAIVQRSCRSTLIEGTFGFLDTTHPPVMFE